MRYPARRLMSLLVVALAALIAILVWVRRSNSRDSAPVAAEDGSFVSGSAGTRRLEALPTGGQPEDPAPAKAMEFTPPTHAQGAICDSCTGENCSAKTDGCDTVADPADRRLCEELYACFMDPSNHCVTQGDSLKCWCGTNPTTCVTANEGPTRANGPCLDKIFAAGRSTDADTIRHRFVDATFPLGRAVNLALCRGTFCASDCKVK